MNIVLYIFNMNKGGAERVMSRMANFWAEKGWDVSLVTIGKATPMYPLNPRINIVSMGLDAISKNPLEAIWMNGKRYTALLGFLRAQKPDVIISFTTTCNILAGLAGKRAGVPRILSERTNPFLQPLPKFWKAMRKFSYNRANMLVVQTEGVKRFFQAYNCPLAVIANPLNLEKVIPASGDRNIIIAMGRLSPIKQFDGLIRAFAETEHKGWELWILGEGNERPVLEELITSFGLEKTVKLKGQVENVYEYLSQGSIFVMNSRYEGYPNALIEAMASGLAVISTDCEFGPGEIILHKENGLLVPLNDQAALVEALTRLIDRPELRIKMGKNALNARKKHDITLVIGEWEKLIRQLKK